MGKRFVWWFLWFIAFVLTLSAEVVIVVGGVRQPWYVVPVDLGLLIVTAVGVYSWWPLRRGSDSFYAEIVPFSSVLRHSKFNGEALALLLKMKLEDLSVIGLQRTSLGVFNSSTLNVKFGVADVSVPWVALDRFWLWVRALELVKVQIVIEETSNPAKLLMWLGLPRTDTDAARRLRVGSSAVQLGAGSAGVEIALFSLALIVLRLLDPIALAQRFSAESNYVDAISIYKDRVAEARKPTLKFELELAEAEINWYCADSALKRLERLKSRRRASQTKIKSLIAKALFSRGEYAKCKAIAEQELERSPDYDVALSLRWLLADVAACNEHYDEAGEQWDEVTRMVAKELARKLRLKDDWSQLTFAQLSDELGTAASKRSDHFPVVWHLSHAWIQRGLCYQRLGQNPTEAFEYAIESLKALNLVDERFGRPRHLLARIFRLVATYWRGQNDSEKESAALKDGLQFEDDAIQKYTIEIGMRPGDIGVSGSHVWSYIGKFDYLYRMARLAADEAKRELEKRRAKALKTITDQLETIGETADKFRQAEVAYAKACLSSIESRIDETNAFLGQAIALTYSTETEFSMLMNRAKLDEDFDNMRDNAEFRNLVHLPKK